MRRKPKRSDALEPIDKVLLALRFYASDNFLQDISDTVGVNKATISRAVFLAKEAISKQKFRAIP